MTQRFWGRTEREQPIREAAGPRVAPPCAVVLPRLLTEQEAARHLGISVDTLQLERKDRRIGYVMIRRRLRYTEQHLAAYIQSRSVNPCDEGESPSAAIIGSQSG